MALGINTNMASLNAQRNLTSSQASLQTSLQRLSSGLRINSAKDDAAGLAIADRMSSQIRGLNQAVRNANDGISLAQTAEGALGQVGDALQRIRELAVQSANATNSDGDRQKINGEVSQLINEIGRLADTTSFNGLKVLDGSYTNQQYQVGANAGQTIAVSVGDSRTTALGSNVAASTQAVLAKSGTTATSYTTDTLSINGTNIDLSKAGTSLDSVVSAINAKSGNTGVTAARDTTTAVNLGSFTTSTSNASSDVLSINGVAITFDSSVVDANSAVAKINTLSSQTGVTASVDTSNNVILTNANGGDVTVNDKGGNVFGNVTSSATDMTYSAGIQLSTGLSQSISVTDSANDFHISSTATAYQLSSLDVNSVASATKAIKTIDFALNQVNNNRANLGAIQNRFTSVVNSLQITSENLTGSRSRITDADFASETANLTRSQILQQAGTAMLAQANQLPQGVMALLR